MRSSCVMLVPLVVNGFNELALIGKNDCPLVAAQLDRVSLRVGCQINVLGLNATGDVQAVSLFSPVDCGSAVHDETPLKR